MNKLLKCISIILLFFLVKLNALMIQPGKLP